MCLYRKPKVKSLDSSTFPQIISRWAIRCVWGWSDVTDQLQSAFASQVVLSRFRSCDTFVCNVRNCFEVCDNGAQYTMKLSLGPISPSVKPKAEGPTIIFFFHLANAFSICLICSQSYPWKRHSLFPQKMEEKHFPEIIRKCVRWFNRVSHALAQLMFRWPNVSQTNVTKKIVCKMAKPRPVSQRRVHVIICLFVTCEIVHCHHVRGQREEKLNVQVPATSTCTWVNHM